MLQNYQVCIEAFSRMHGGHQDPRLCTELERMSTFLVNSLNVGGLISLVNSLHPKPLHSGGQVWRRRRDLLSELLKLADSTPSSRVPVAPPADANERCSTVGMGGWVPDKAMSVPDSSKLVLTVALEPDTLADLRSDDLSGTTAVNAAVARFCLRQAHEGRCEEALWQARSLLECAEGNKGGSKKGRIAPALCDTFWAYIFEVIPYAETAGNKGLLSDLVIACARRVPCAATAVALAQHPPEKVSILEMHKFVAAGTGLSSQPFALAFGCYSVLGFKESAIKELSNACRRLPKAVIFCEVRLSLLFHWRPSSVSLSLALPWRFNQIR